MKGTIRLTIRHPGFTIAWEIMEWHNESGIEYRPTIDDRRKVCWYEFDDSRDAALFKLRWGGKIVAE